MLIDCLIPSQSTLHFIFSSEVQDGIRKGIYEVVVKGDGTPIGTARNKATGRFVAQAIHTIANQKSLADVQAGIQALQTSIGILQATTTLIGVGTVAGVVLSAVNLHQTLKLREDVKKLRLEVHDGFINLKKALKGSEELILRRLEQVADDVEFRQHQTELIKAYGLFAKGIQRLQAALKLRDVELRKIEIVGARGMLLEASAQYDNSNLLSNTCSAGKLRRQECAWAIDLAITKTFELQDAYEMVSDRLFHLQHKIRQDSLSIVENCQSDDELDFIFPELTRIHTHDIAALVCWKSHVDWFQELPSADKKLLESDDFTEPVSESSPITVPEPQEQKLYDHLKSKSHFMALRDQLKFIIQPDLRQDHELYISQQAPKSGYPALVPANWQDVPDLTVANLYWYFKNKAA